MMRTIVIGFGFMGRTHAINILKTPAMELCAIVNRTPLTEVLKSSGGNFNTRLLDREKISQTPFFDDPARCLAEIKPDVAIICLPTFLHYSVTRLCLEHGCHVLLEKPICLDVEQAEEMIALAKERRRTFMVAHCVRFFPEYELLKNTIDGKRFGKLKLLKMHRISGEPSWGSWQEKQVKETCGGALFDLLIHDIDFVNYALGEPEKIWNTPPLTAAFKAGYINSVWEYPASIPVAIVEGGNCFPSLRPFECGYSGVFEDGTIIYNSLEPGKVKFVTPDKLVVEDLSGEKSGYLKQLEYFIDCVERGQYPAKCSPEDALAAVKLCRRHLE